MCELQMGVPPLQVDASHPAVLKHSPETPPSASQLNPVGHETPDPLHPQTPFPMMHSGVGPWQRTPLLLEHCVQ
jgi:hypothetical protein